MEDRGHKWQLGEEGEVYSFGLDTGYHNGPRCTVCDYGYCEHCNDGPQVDCPGDGGSLDADFDDSKLDPTILALENTIRTSVGLPLITSERP